MSWQALASLTLISATILGAPHAVAASSCTRTSPGHTVALVELYTSEGCSSCPPADRWLSRLPSRFPAEQLVPLALHVDYWDYIGWKDPFAQAQFSDRQRRLARLSGTTTIYTPGVFAGMRELRGWNNATTLERRVREINRLPARADVSVGMRAVGGREAEIEVSFSLPPTERFRQSLQGVLVLYEEQLVSDVRHGENRGVTLRHDHVVRQWSPHTLNAGSEPQRVRKTITLHPDWNAAELGVAAFVEDLQTGEVLQALALPGCMPAAAG